MEVANGSCERTAHIIARFISARVQIHAVQRVPVKERVVRNMYVGYRGWRGER